MEKVTEQFDTLALTATGLPLLLIVALKQSSVSGQSLVLPLMGFGTALAFIALYLLAKRRRLRIAADREAIVAEFLNELPPLGYRIYHDYPTDYGNIDHVVIGPAGVFAVETKARGKSKGAEGQARACSQC